MKLIYINLLLIFVSINGFAQTSKVAILDFENTSGKAEYDALGKAMSSMLITDLSNNIHPKKVEFFERSQLNKLLDEQKLQKSKNFDAKTAVDFGKLSGVNYVFVGSVFVMDGNCNITSKLVDVQTSKIILSKEANGKIETWLQLKSQLAEVIAQQLNNPITLDPSYRDQTTPLATLNQYGKVLSSMDHGDTDKAEQMRSLFEETNPDFKYFVDLKDDINELKKQVAKNTADIEVLNKSGGRVIDAQTYKELKNNLLNELLIKREKYQIIFTMLERFPSDCINELPFLASQISEPSDFQNSNLDSLIGELKIIEQSSRNYKINEIGSKYICFRIQHVFEIYHRLKSYSQNNSTDEKILKYGEILNIINRIQSNIVFDVNSKIHLTRQIVLSELILDNLKIKVEMNSKEVQFLKIELGKELSLNFPEFLFLQDLNLEINNAALYDKFLSIINGDDVLGMNRKSESLMYSFLPKPDGREFWGNSIEYLERLGPEIFDNVNFCSQTDSQIKSTDNFIAVEICSKDLISNKYFLDENGEIEIKKLSQFLGVQIKMSQYFNSVFIKQHKLKEKKPNYFYFNRNSSMWELIVCF